jgi:hypothetical protein
MRALLLPGSSNPICADQKPIYDVVRREAETQGIELRILTYPGQRGASSGAVEYATALTYVLEEARGFKPDWLIGRSLGACVALGLFGSREAWLNDCQGVVVWGPPKRELTEKKWSREKIHEYIKFYQEVKETYLSPALFYETPDPAELITEVNCNLRIVRGSEDEFNTGEYVAHLALRHRQVQPNYFTEVQNELDGIGHGITKIDPTNADLPHSDFTWLFNPFDKPKER